MPLGLLSMWLVLCTVTGACPSPQVQNSCALSLVHPAQSIIPYVSRCAVDGSRIQFSSVHMISVSSPCVFSVDLLAPGRPCHNCTKATVSCSKVRLQTLTPHQHVARLVTTLSLGHIKSELSLPDVNPIPLLFSFCLFSCRPYAHTCPSSPGHCVLSRPGQLLP